MTVSGPQDTPDDAPEDIPQHLSAARSVTGPGNSGEAPAFDIRIARDGTWYYKGTPIERPALVRLFSTVLQRDGAGTYWLVTPVERGRIVVEDAPFVAVELDRRVKDGRQILMFRTNVDDWCEAGPDRPIRVVFDPETGEPRPYVTVRDGLEAVVARTVYYHMAELVEEEQGRIGLWSGGRFFPLDQVA